MNLIVDETRRLRKSRQLQLGSRSFLSDSSETIYTKEQLIGIMRLLQIPIREYIINCLNDFQPTFIRGSLRPSEIREKNNKQYYISSRGYLFFMKSFPICSSFFRLSFGGALQFYYSYHDKILINKNTNLTNLFKLINTNYPIGPNNVNLVKKYLKGKCNYNSLFLKELQTMEA